MIELQIYAPGLRNLDKILALDQELSRFRGIRYKVDENHDIVYFEIEAPTFTIDELNSAFKRIDLTPRVVGSIPPELKSSNKKTQPLNF